MSLIAGTVSWAELNADAGRRLGDAQAARWLTESRRVKAVALDTASIDYGQSTLYESHRILYERDIPAFENLTNLDRLPATGAFVVALGEVEAVGRLGVSRCRRLILGNLLQGGVVPYPF